MQHSAHQQGFGLRVKGLGFRVEGLEVHHVEQVRPRSPCLVGEDVA